MRQRASERWRAERASARSELVATFARANARRAAGIGADCAHHASSEDPDSEMRCCERGEEEYGHACRESECAAYLSSFTHEDLECHPSVITGDLPIDSLVESIGQFASVCSPGASECHEAPNYFQEVDEACERDCTTDDDDRDLPRCERGQYERGKKCAGDKKVRPRVRAGRRGPADTRAIGRAARERASFARNTLLTRAFVLRSHSAPGPSKRHSPRRLRRASSRRLRDARRPPSSLWSMLLAPH